MTRRQLWLDVALGSALIGVAIGVSCTTMQSPNTTHVAKTAAELCVLLAKAAGCAPAEYGCQIAEDVLPIVEELQKGYCPIDGGTSKD